MRRMTELVGGRLGVPAVVALVAHAHYRQAGLVLGYLGGQVVHRGAEGADVAKVGVHAEGDHLVVVSQAESLL